MPAYHSALLGDSTLPVLAGFATPDVQRIGSASVSDPQAAECPADIVDEALALYRLNAFCRAFDIRGPADRTLVYLLLHIGDVLSFLRARDAASAAEAQRAVASSALATASVAVPGEAAFPLDAGMFPKPADAEEAERLRSYLAAVRSETTARLIARVYSDGGAPSFLWLPFGKRRFMNRSLVSV